MVYSRNTAVKEIVDSAREAKVSTGYVFDKFTGKIIRKDLFCGFPEAFDAMNERTDCMSWYMLHNYLHMGFITHPVYNEKNEYIGMKTVMSDFVSLAEILKKHPRIDFDEYVKYYNEMHEREIIMFKKPVKGDANFR